MSPHAKIRLKVLQYGWDDYTAWKRGGGEKPENPYDRLSFAKRAWEEGFKMAKRGEPRPETLGEIRRDIEALEKETEGLLDEVLVEVET